MYFFSAAFLCTAAVVINSLELTGDQARHFGINGSTLTDKKGERGFVMSLPRETGEHINS